MASRTAPPRKHHPRFQYEEFDPLRLPDWRFNLVQDAVQSGRIQRRGVDPWMKRLAPFLKQWFALKTVENRRAHLFGKYPDLYYAMVWYHHDGGEFTALMEAFLLADVPLEEIAQRRGLYLPALEAYEALFFNVLDHLDDEVYVVRNVLAELAVDYDTLTSDEQRQACYKLFGYFGGPEAINTVFSGMPQRRRVTSDQLSEWCDNTVKSLMRRASMVAIRGMDVKQHNVMRMIELQLKAHELDQDERLATGQASGAAKGVQDVANALLGAINWCIGREGFKQMTDAEQLLHASPIGLTATEANRIAAGDTLDALQELAKVQKLPARRVIEHEKPAKDDE